MSPTQRSLAHLRGLGYTAKVVERRNPFARIRQDLFGADVLALKPGEPVLVVQATSGTIIAEVAEVRRHIHMLKRGGINGLDDSRGW